MLSIFPYFNFLSTDLCDGINIYHKQISNQNLPPKEAKLSAEETLRKILHRKYGIWHFYNYLKGRVGKQSIQNRLSFMGELQTDWTSDLTLDDTLGEQFWKRPIWILIDILLYLTITFTCIVCYYAYHFIEYHTPHM